MRVIFTIITCCYIAFTPLWSQNKTDFDEKKYLIESEMKKHHSLFKALQTPADPSYDVTYYRLDLKITAHPLPNYLNGSVLMKAFSRQNNLNVIHIDLVDSMIVDSVKAGGILCAFTQHDLNFDVTLDHTYMNGELIMTEVFYRGVPGSTGLGSFTFSTHGSKPWVYTLSEPYGAKDWWPCKDHPSDKADSVDILITIDSTCKAGSNGRLVSVLNNGDGTRTFHWQERYPISTYLVAVTFSDFAEFTNWFHYSPTDSMPVLNYVFAEHLAAAQAALGIVPDMIGLYSEFYGMYPFVREKYGHVEFGWGGAMEHQTMTSTVTFSIEIIAHELSHQWFGDMITCRTWSDLWLNEGFATYSTALGAEVFYGTDLYWDIMNGNMASAKTATGSLFITDTANVAHLFDGSLVYAKGACVLHMLRHVLGDSVFFAVMYNYANTPSLMYNTASTQDFQDICETTSGRDLDYFFNEWIYGERFPNYNYSWSALSGDSGYQVTISLNQTTGTSNPAFFTMPVDFKLMASGWDTTVTLMNNAASQVLIISGLSRQPTAVLLDPQGWILKNAVLTDVNNGGIQLHDFELSQNYPNPFNPSTLIPYRLSENCRVELKIYNMLGQEVRTLINGLKNAGAHTVSWDGKNDAGNPVSSGTYLYRLKAGEYTASKKMLWIK